MRVPDRRDQMPAELLAGFREDAGELIDAGFATPESLRGTRLYYRGGQVFGPEPDIDFWCVWERDRMRRVKVSPNGDMSPNGDTSGEGER